MARAPGSLAPLAPCTSLISRCRALQGAAAPVAIDGPVVEAERHRLDQVFAIRLASAAAWPDMQSAFAAIF